MNLVELKKQIDSVFEMADNPELIEVIIRKEDSTLKKSEVAIKNLDFIFGDRIKLRINPAESI